MSNPNSELPDWVRPTTRQAIWIATQLVRETGKVVHIDTPYGPVRVDDELERLGNAMPYYLIEPGSSTHSGGDG